MTHIAIKKSGVVVMAVTLLLLTTSVALANEGDTIIIINKYGIGAPFLTSWIPVWAFALSGGIGSTFFKIEAIDKHFRYLVIAKPFLGLFGAMALCLLLATGSEPPRTVLAFYAFISALLSAPLLQGLLALASLPRNQASLFNSINPFKFKIVVDENSAKQGADDDKR